MKQKFSDPLSAAVAKRDANVLETVREALKHGRTALAFQPVIQAGAPQNVVFYEGLIRIIDPAGRHIPARDFIAEVENTELGRLIDCATLQLGLATLAEQPAVRLSVNMSSQSIGYPKWVRILEDGLHKSPDLPNSRPRFSSTSCVNSPLGPLTDTTLPWMESSTPLGTVMGFFPIRLMTD